MNPRNGFNENFDDNRITRRAIPYDDAKRFADNEITKLTKEKLEANKPKRDVGLLFMCYQSSIETQFRILQEFWANQGQIGPHALNVQDSIISQGTNPPKTLSQQWGQPAQTAPFTFNKFVTTRGGEYFFTPSITFLKNINDF